MDPLNNFSDGVDRLTRQPDLAPETQHKRSPWRSSLTHQREQKPDDHLFSLKCFIAFSYQTAVKISLSAYQMDMK